MEQLPRVIHARPEGMSFGELFAATCNTTPADSSKFKEELAKLVAHKEIEIVSIDGSRRHSSNTITDKDQLIGRLARVFLISREAGSLPPWGSEWRLWSQNECRPVARFVRCLTR